MLRLAIMDIASAGIPDVHMLIQVHDQILFEIPIGTRNQVLPIIVDLMEQAMPKRVPMDVPLPVDVSVGPSWGVMEDWNG